MSKTQGKIIVKEFIFNEQRYPCKNNVPLITINRKTKPTQQLNIIEKEIGLIYKIDPPITIKKQSLSYQWLSSIFGSSIQVPLLKCCTLFFGYLLDVTVPRDVYRRSFTMYYWIDKYLKSIAKLISFHSLSIIVNEKEYKFTIPKPYHVGWDLTANQNSILSPGTISSEIFNQWDAAIQEDK